MADHALDGVLRELEAAVALANARLHDHSRAGWHRGFGLDGADALQFQMPTLGPDGWRKVQVPLESLMCRHGMSVAELRVEIDCALRILRPSAPGAGLRIAVDAGARHASHRLELRLHDTQVAVWLDGVELRHCPHAGVASKVAPPPSWFGVHRGRPRLLLEDEDARRAITAIGPVLTREAVARRNRLLLLAASVSAAVLAAVVLYRMIF